jgi:predicted LPLAT superfamily acyltransferase
MAGDRISANTPKSSELVQILDSKCLLPKGVFKFAKSMDVPIFFIACMKEKHNRYKIYLKQSFEKDMPKEFASFLQELILKYPKQWYNFYDFFEK